MKQEVRDDGGGGGDDDDDDGGVVVQKWTQTSDDVSAQWK